MNDYTYEHRKYILGAAIIIVFLVYIVRLFSLQILSDEYKSAADSNAFYKKTIYPSRGLIYDRNGELLVYNQPAYDSATRQYTVQWTWCLREDVN